MSDTNPSEVNLPSWFQELASVFGGPSQSAFGTAAFFQSATDDGATLEQQALSWYQLFCGKSWERFGPENWLGSWHLVHERIETANRILPALETLTDGEAQRSAMTMLDGAESPQQARAALERAFDDSSVEQLHIYNLGDGSAMSGILIAARYATGESAAVAFLLD